MLEKFFEEKPSLIKISFNIFMRKAYILYFYYYLYRKMVKQKIFIRLAKTEKKAFKADGNIKQIIDPIWSNSNPRTRRVLPTVHFAIEVDIPDEKFDIEKIAVAKINFKLEEDRLMVEAVDAI